MLIIWTFLTFWVKLFNIETFSSNISFAHDQKDKGGPSSEWMWVLTLPSYVIEVFVKKMLGFPVIVDSLNKVSSQSFIEILGILHHIIQWCHWHIIHKVLLQTSQHNVVDRDPYRSSPVTCTREIENVSLRHTSQSIRWKHSFIINSELKCAF